MGERVEIASPFSAHRMPTVHTPAHARGIVVRFPEIARKARRCARET
jgi:hypothetical protein